MTSEDFYLDHPRLKKIFYASKWITISEKIFF